MAYVVARSNGRFEVRESVHTPKGPRARSLAGFEVLSDDVLAMAERRAIRPFDAGAVIASGRRAGAQVLSPDASELNGAGRGIGGSSRRFVEASRRMAMSMQRPSSPKLTDPGAALIDLLGFADVVARSQPARPFESLAFPVLARLVEGRRAIVGTN
jgi:hypothetical protein